MNEDAKFNCETPYNAFDKKFEQIRTKLAEFRLKPIMSTVHPRNFVALVECYDCREFWMPNKPATHASTCTNPLKNSTDWKQAL